MAPALSRLVRAPGAARKQVRRVLATSYYRRYFTRHPDHPALDERRAISALRDADRLLFCCWGNICRSPMAERYLRTVDGGDITVESAGLGERAGRPSPPEAVDAATRYGVDLSDHRSVTTTERVVAESDVVFLMDFHNYHLLRTKHGGADNVFFLSVFARGDDNAGPEIPDPAGKSVDTFDRIYATITDAVDAVAAVTRGDRPAVPADWQARRGRDGSGAGGLSE